MGSIQHSPLRTAAAPTMYDVGVENDFDDVVVARLESVDLYEYEDEDEDEDEDDADVHALIDSAPLMYLEPVEDEIYRSIVADDVEEYSVIAADVDAYVKLLSMEMKQGPIANYMESVQTEIDSTSRAFGVALVILFAEILGCTPDMLHLAVKNLDRYLSGNSVDVKNLLTAGVTCLKMTDYRPDVDDAYAFLCEGEISGDEFADFEARIVSYLKNDVVTVPTAYSYLRSFVDAAQHGRHAPLQSLDSVASYFADASLLSTTMLRFPPSMVAASSVFLAQYVLDPDSEKPWSGLLRDYTMFEASHLQDCVLALHEFLACDEITLPAIPPKYTREETEFAALKIIPPAIPLHTFEDVYSSKFGW